MFTFRVVVRTKDRTQSVGFAVQAPALTFPAVMAAMENVETMIKGLDRARTGSQRANLDNWIIADFSIMESGETIFADTVFLPAGISVMDGGHGAGSGK
jgi:hypothetical protein